MFNTKKETDMLKRILIYSLFLCVLVLGASGCGGSKTAAEGAGNAPSVVDCTVDAGCDGGENDQYVNILMKFDRNVTCSDSITDDLRVVIGGERVKSDNIQVSQDDSSKDEINFRISLNKVTNGVLEITAADGSSTIKSVKDESGKYCAEAPEIKKLIPSGVTVEQTEASAEAEHPAWTRIKVMSPPSHRSMVWIQLVVNGEPVQPDDLSSPDILDDTAAGIHEHEFLWATEGSVAEDIAKAVNDFYGERFTAESNGSEVTVTALDTSGSTDSVELRLYEY